MKAFPTTAQTWDIHNGRDLSGMDLRDYFAAAFLTNTWCEGKIPEDAAKAAYAYADALMKERVK
jgi:hypothetical protein